MIKLQISLNILINVNSYFFKGFCFNSSTTSGQQLGGCVRRGRPPLPVAQADDHDRAAEEVQAEEDGIAEGRVDAGPGQRSQEDRSDQAKGQGNDVPLTQVRQVKKFSKCLCVAFF